MAPAGSLYAPMSDLGLFMISMFKGGLGQNGRYLEESTLKSMWLPQFDGSPTNGYGIGFRLTDFHGHQKIGHGGAIYGFSTQLSAIPELEIGVACASSTLSATPTPLVPIASRGGSSPTSPIVWARVGTTLW